MSKARGTHRVGAVEGCEGVGAQPLAQSKLMRHLDNRRHAHCPRELCPDALEHVVVEEDLALDLPTDIVEVTGAGEAKLRAAVVE